MVLDMLTEIVVAQKNMNENAHHAPRNSSSNNDTGLLLNTTSAGTVQIAIPIRYTTQKNTNTHGSSDKNSSVHELAYPT